VSFGDSFGWAFRDPQWGRKLIVQGLIGLIPVVGQIALFGWVMQCLDNLRSGRPQLPEPGFPLARGFSVWLPLLVLGILAEIIPWILYGVGGGLASANGGSGVGVFFVSIGYLLAFVFGIAAAFMGTAEFAAAYEGGMGAAFNYPAVLRRAIQNPVASLLGIVGYWISGLGSILCGIGVFLTYAYGMSIVAGLLTTFIRQDTPAIPLYGQPGAGNYPYGYGPAGYPQQPGADSQPAAPPYYGQPGAQYPPPPAPWGAAPPQYPGQYPPPQPQAGYPPAPEQAPPPQWPPAAPPTAWEQGEKGNDEPTAKFGTPPPPQDDEPPSP
jgi:hypothetical protein